MFLFMIVPVMICSVAEVFYLFIFLISKKTNILKEGKDPNRTQEVDERNQPTKREKAHKLPTT